MPKSATINEDVTDGATVHAAINGINEEKLKGYVKSIEEEQAEIDDIMARADAACQPHIDQIKEIKKAAANDGIPKKPLAAKIRERTLRRKADSVTDALSEDQKEIFAEISLKLGDLPLFRGLDG